MRRVLLPLVLLVFATLWWRSFLAAVLHATELPVATAKATTPSTDPNDWPTYNHDCMGTRHNPAEKSLRRENVGQLSEKWRFPPADSSEKIGVVHATVVVNGHVYFG